MRTWAAWEMGWECGSRLLSPLSKKFLWEELELVREEVTFIYQKLRECLKARGLEGVGLLCFLCPLSSRPNRGPGG